MYLHEVTLTVGRETQVVVSNSTRGLAVGAADKELEARCRIRIMLVCGIAGFYGLVFALTTYWDELYGSCLTIIVFTGFESLAYHFGDGSKMPVVDLWYNWQWYKKWQLEYTRLNTADSLTISL
jgi:hypothetical protein